MRRPEEDERKGPIPLEESPLLPWEVRSRFQQRKHEKFLEKTQKEMIQEDKTPWTRIILSLIALGAAATWWLLTQ